LIISSVGDSAVAIFNYDLWDILFNVNKLKNIEYVSCTETVVLPNVVKRWSLLNDTHGCTEEFINEEDQKWAWSLAGACMILQYFTREYGDLNVEFDLCYSDDFGKKFDITDEYARGVKLKSEWPT